MSYAHMAVGFPLAVVGVRWNTRIVVGPDKPPVFVWASLAMTISHCVKPWGYIGQPTHALRSQLQKVLDDKEEKHLF